MSKHIAPALVVLGLAATIAGGPTAPVVPGSSHVQHVPGRPSGCHLPGPYEYPKGARAVKLRPRDFTTRIDNPYWPMRPGTVWRYVETSGAETQQIRVRVTHRTTVIRGIRARVVRDVVRSRGVLVEDTRDWYAQDSGGSIWYLGEATKEYEDGKVVSTEGSWRYGRDGAQAGIVVPARTHAACRYREEYLDGVAQDRALVLSRQESLETPTGFHRHVLHTANSTPLEPAVLENKFYARGVGPVLEIDVSPTWARAVLVSVTRR
jgi:hypothetical protein